jgi:hypothetical protein
VVIVVEYGDHIGTLKNLFGDMQQAVLFAKKIIDLSGRKYECIGRFLWYCQEKQEYIKIDDKKEYSY